jgi:hypothetical protein
MAMARELRNPVGLLEDAACVRHDPFAERRQRHEARGALDE